MFFEIHHIDENSIKLWIEKRENYYVGAPLAFGSIIGDGYLYNKFEMVDGKCKFIHAKSYFNCDYEQLNLHQAYLLYLSRHPKYLHGIVERLLDLWNSGVRCLGCHCIEYNCHAFVLNEIFVLFLNVYNTIFKCQPLMCTFLENGVKKKSDLFFRQAEGEIWKFCTGNISGARLRDDIIAMLENYIYKQVAHGSSRMGRDGCDAGGEGDRQEGHNRLGIGGESIPYVNFQCIRMLKVLKESWRASKVCKRLIFSASGRLLNSVT